LAAVAMSALKFLAVFEKYKFPKVSAILALIKAKSAKYVYYFINLLPLNYYTCFGLLKISGFPVPF